VFALSGRAAKLDLSLYEVSDIVPGESFRARDLVRGGEPVLISERSATVRSSVGPHCRARSFRWDRKCR